MARPRKRRKVCSLPGNFGFKPMNGIDDKNQIIMGVDEYETIRLIDLFDYTQEECATQMNIARTTVQGIYNDARKKIADALVNGRELYIEAGDFALCEGGNFPCGEKSEEFCCRKDKENEEI